MSLSSQIEWTEATWNPTVGCSKKSPGCRGCYAIRQVHRLAHNPHPQVSSANSGLTVLRNGALQWTGKVRLIESRLSIPVKRRKPTTYFVNSLSDLFHPSLPDSAIAEVFRVMYRCNWHTFQILTKHGETHGRMVQTMRRIVQDFGPMRANIWMGVSVENRAAVSRIDLLRQVPAAVRFISFEPLLENLGPLDLPGIALAIIGGESGKGARPCDPAWIRSIVQQARAQHVAPFVKQLGRYPIGLKLDSSKGSDIDEWPLDLQVRQLPAKEVMSRAAQT